MKVIFKKRETTSLGRNGTMRTKGVDMYQTVFMDNAVRIYPINSKGNMGRCSICIPAEDVQKVCATMLSLAK